ncbi:hypothetical protein [Hyalangium versicolor]|uniref:hypothetical protein n=1 Tax=Hyalangium versicolor TaxID=2861190 RepID=UPI001CCFB6AC|nr:hypothetical protein [Hyalangium versicolor]
MVDSCRGSNRRTRREALTFLSLLAGAACVPRSLSDETPLLPPTPPGLRSVYDWEMLFLGNWDDEHRMSFLPMSTSLDSAQFYTLAYGIDGNTAMYRATGKVQYLDRALLYVTHLVNSARDSWSLPDSQFKDTYRGWASENPDTPGQEVALNESYCWRYVSRLLRVIRETPALYEGKYRGQYHRLLEFSEKDIFEKWYVRGANSYVYRANTHMASHWAAIAMNLHLITPDANRRAWYLEVFNNINRSLPNVDSSLRAQVVTSPVNAGAAFWNDRWGSHSRPGQDVAHGNGVVGFIIEARDAGMEWTDDDVRALTVTLDSVIWPAADQYAQYVDGSGEGDGWFNDGFMKLGRYDAELQHRLDFHPVGNNTQFFGNAALNVRLLSEAAAR